MTSLTVVKIGGLMSFGPSRDDCYGRAIQMVADIENGNPIPSVWEVQDANFELVVSQAKAMAPIAGDSSKHQFGTSMPQRGHPPHHSMTSSALTSKAVGTVIPSVFAVLRLITSWNLVGACTARLAGFSPLRMRSTYEVERQTISIVSGP
jgi:hypothetical protein